MTDARSGTNDIWEALYTQRAIRRWKDEPVPEELIWRVIEAGTKAPSGSNLQPWRFIVIQEAETRAALAAELRKGLENPGLQQMIENAIKSGTRGDRLMMTGAQSLFENLAQAPVFIVPCLYQVQSPTPDASTLLAGSSIYQAVQNILLAARALGLGTVMTTFQGAVDGVLRERCGIPAEATPAAIIPMGFPRRELRSDEPQARRRGHQLGALGRHEAARLRRSRRLRQGAEG